MRSRNLVLAVMSVLVLSPGGYLVAQANCTAVFGTIFWSVVPAPNEPHGRVLGSATGGLEGPTTDSILTITPGPAGIKTVDFPIFMTGPGDQLYTRADATFVPIAGNVVSDTQVMTVTGGTGKYANATGTIYASGTGQNLFGPAAGPGSTNFNLVYYGSLCGVAAP